jgi:hypothetical protein
MPLVPLRTGNGPEETSLEVAPRVAAGYSTG